MTERDPFLEAALAEARAGLSEGGIPIGSVLVYRGEIIGRGHNQRAQRNDPILHAEMDCIRNAGRQPASIYRECILYSTLSPCPMCSGTAVLFKIPHVVIGENKNFMGAEDYLRSQGIRVDVIQDQECIDLMKEFIQNKPTLWCEDIAV